MIAHGCIFLISFFWEIGLYSVYMGDTTVHPCTLDIKANLAPPPTKKKEYPFQYLCCLCWNYYRCPPNINSRIAPSPLKWWEVRPLTVYWSLHNARTQILLHRNSNHSKLRIWAEGQPVQIQAFVCLVWILICSGMQSAPEVVNWLKYIYSIS